jgi:hypothetical protein
MCDCFGFMFNRNVDVARHRVADRTIRWPSAQCALRLAALNHEVAKRTMALVHQRLATHQIGPTNCCMWARLQKRALEQTWQLLPRSLLINVLTRRAHHRGYCVPTPTARRPSQPTTAFRACHTLYSRWDSVLVAAPSAAGQLRPHCTVLLYPKDRVGHPRLR